MEIWKHWGRRTSRKPPILVLSAIF